jgi:hypothetical protein
MPLNAFCCGWQFSECPDVALSCQEKMGRAGLLCPGSSDVDLLGYGKSVIDLNAKVVHRALDLIMPQQSCAIIRILLSH